MNSPASPQSAADNPDLMKATGGAGLYWRLLNYLKPLRWFFCLGVVGFILYSLSNLLFFELLKQLVDTIGEGISVSGNQRLFIPLALVGIVIFRGFGGFLGSYYMAYVANHVVHRVRMELMRRFTGLSSNYYDSHSAGHLVSTVTYNVSQISAAVSDALTVILREGIYVISLFGYLLFLNWKLTLLFVAVTPLISLVVLYASKKFRKHSNRIQVSMGDVTHILSENLKGMKVVKTFGAEEQVENTFNEASDRNMRQNLKMAIVQSISTPVVQVLVSAALSLLLWLSMAPDVLSAMTPGVFVSYITAAGSILKPIRQLSKINSVIQRGLAAAQSIFIILDEPTEEDTGSRELEQVAGKVEFRDVSFAYSGNETHVLRQVSFQCEPGENIAIVGKSGAGKSTLVNLIPRFYQQSSGEILIDGISTRDVTLKSLRRQIALVSQQVVLFNGTVRENIAYGELGQATDEDICSALSHANALEFVDSLSHGLDTPIGDDGFLLSGGQRQRLSIARALLKNAPILILDEATSALDSESEKAIQSALEHLMKGRTTFVIAHRLSTIENADRILVMDQGEIRETGTHQSLLNQGGLYQQLHQLQFSS